ncbi:hypothetical protein D9V37_01760 [Nocardioides mangrovicus]|uniref:CHY-type domain-containing protein n=1 Tax=Nocardioides mangrovicus TaxID=2478913 RepID=A0A3L8P8L7_9ACTN|nr:hypothetical protein D9V37_01760 [Nocardioides mangrovicus]
MTVRGRLLDAQTRCVHWGSVLDVVAIRLACCTPYYPCRTCHDEAADHPAVTWPPGSEDETAALCGVCHERLTIAEYLSCDNSCPRCGAGFNPGCRLHRGLYFG